MNPYPMYIIIVGLGGIGRNLTQLAVEHGNNVVIIDRDEQRCSEILEHHDVLAITGNATDKSILEDAGIDRADALVATTSDDSVNLMAAQIAKSIFRREKVICRVSDPHLQVLYHKAYEIDTICPTVLTEQSVFRALAK